jgi:dihydroorotase
MAAREGSCRLINTLTLVDGEALPRLPERPPAIWATLPPHQR